ncbi:MAG: hypothetical protein Cons2KO_28250 [Congregibacter sp.]
MTSTQTLLKAIRAFMRDDIAPELSGINAYKQRIALNVLATIERDIRGQPALQQLDTQYAKQMGCAANDSPSRAIARAIRDDNLFASGQPTEAEQMDLLRYLRTRAMLSLAIDNPRYSGLRQARERWKALGERVDEMLMPSDSPNE